jgi:hypothetical protein
MTTKIKTLRLGTWEELVPNKQGKRERRWQVLKTINTLRYAPGDMITKNEVEELLGLNSWKIEIVEKA